MSVGDESVDILFIMGNDSESLPDELVCNSDHSEFTGFSVLPKPSICLPAFGIEPAGIPCGDIDKSSGVCVSVSVDVPSDVYRSSGSVSYTHLLRNIQTESVLLGQSPVWAFSGFSS